MLVLLTHTAPSAPVINITSLTITSTSVRLAWYPPHPDSWNGEVIKYTVLSTLIETTESLENATNTPQLSFSIPSFGQPLMNINDPVRVTLPLKQEMVLINELDEFSTYQFLVFFETSAGRSTNSEDLEVKTLSDSKTVVLAIIVLY